MNLVQAIDRFKKDDRFAQNIVQWATIKPRDARLVDFPENLDADLVATLKQVGYNRLYTHQAQSYQILSEGKNIVVVTPTASGKTICYNLPVLQSLVEARKTGGAMPRALYIFPTKALAQDQMNDLHQVSSALDADIRVYTFDGDTPQPARKAIRNAGHIVITNPDMLHTGILPHHSLWIKLFENLKYVVIDEIHNYRGVFGSHLSNVIRRLKRVCEFYGSSPTFICCSATIANPVELTSQIIHEDVELIDDNGAPSGEKHLVFYNPPVVNKELGIRRSVVSEVSRIAEAFMYYDIQTIIFARSRLRVEILLTYLRDVARKVKLKKDQVCGYRGGYLPTERRKIEKGLREGYVRVVASTNALELGVDIGQLDLCIMSGYPGAVASTWQQAGRAGRRTDVSAAILVASSNPLDQYIINHPKYFLGTPPEKCTIDPKNLIVLMSHLKCAAFEIPFNDGEAFGLDPESTEEILSFLEEHRVLRHAGGKWHWMSAIYPAQEISLRSASPENVVIIDRTDQARVIGEIDTFSAPLIVHEGAIYIHQSSQYTVEELDLEDHKAYVRQVEVDYYTDAESKTELQVLDIFRGGALDGKTDPASDTAIRRGEGEVAVRTMATMYKKIKFATHDNVGWGKIHLPEQEMHSTAFWLDFPTSLQETLSMSEADLGGGLRALANILVKVSPLQIMCDPADIRSVSMVRAPFTARPTIYLYDVYPGGVGYSARLYESYQRLLAAAAELVSACTCERGCPSCVGPALEVGDRGKKGARQLIKSLREALAEDRGRQASVFLNHRGR
ncbi:DEAD/DEAH box helicase [Candidatus Hydrogenedentota bacterium]